MYLVEENQKFVVVVEELEKGDIQESLNKNCFDLELACNYFEINWDLDSFELFRKYFQDYNTLLQESKVNLENELEIIDIIKAYIERFYIKKEKTAINLKKSNSYILFRKELDMEIEDISSDSDEDASYCERLSLTSNAFLPRKISISNIINENLNLEADNEE